MSVITISRQLGSLSCDIARATANRLGYRLVWREIINQAARVAGAPDVALAVIDELGIFGLETSSEAESAYRAAVRNIMLEMAEEGNIIILGRAGQVILSGRPDTLHVRLTAPLEVRINRVAARLSIPYEAARAQVLASDRHRKSYLKKGYQVDWNNPDLYDLMINTANVSAETAVEMILHALASRLQEHNIVQIGRAHV